MGDTAHDITKSSIYKEIMLIRYYNCKNNGIYDKDEDCPICTDTLKDEYVLILPCNHVFHRECIMENMFTHCRDECPFSTCGKEGKLVHVGVEK